MSRTSLGLLFVLVGCADRSLTPCDIADPACQEAIYYMDLRVRGDGYDPFGGIPPIQTKTEDQYRQDLEADAAKAAASNPTPEPWWDATLALLKLIPPSQNTAATSIDDQVTNTAAFYSWDTRSVTIVQHPNQTSDWQGMVQNMSTLAHELYFSLHGQYAFNNRLVPQAQDVAGGMYSVRGYPESFAAGDSGFAGSLDIGF